MSSAETLLTQMEALKRLGLLSPVPKRHELGGYLSVENTAGDSVWTTLNKLVRCQPAPVLPLFTAKDLGVPDRRETLLEGQMVSGFLVGGEMRLCFPQVLNTILKSFHVTEINRAMQELNIHMAPTGVEQLEVLKIAGILPASAPNCGLITKSDAERLCNYLLRRPNLVYYGQQSASGRQSQPHRQRPILSPGPSAIPVAHECFGRAEGSFLTDLYLYPRSDCIECWECGDLTTPEKFVTHSHRFLETKTCHWGFDSANWREYVHLQRSVDTDPGLQESLKVVKGKFLPLSTTAAASHSVKRKANEVSPPSGVKKLCTPVPNTSAPANNNNSYQLMCDPAALAYCYKVATDLAAQQTLASQGDQVKSAASLTTDQLTFVATKVLSDLLSTNSSRKATVAHVAAVEERQSKEEDVDEKINVCDSRCATPVKVKVETNSEVTSSSISSEASAKDRSHSTLHHEGPKKFLLHKCEEEQMKLQQKLVEAQHHLSSPHHSQSSEDSDCSDSPEKTDEERSLDDVLEKYLPTPETLRLVRKKVAQSQQLLENRIDSLSMENRFLQQEVAYLRTTSGSRQASILPFFDAATLQSSAKFSSLCGGNAGILAAALTNIPRTAASACLNGIM